MNKHLLQTRLKSIAHYAEELKLLAEASSVTRRTRDELILDLKQFFPFKDGDVITDGKVIRRIVSLGNPRETTWGSGPELQFVYKYQVPEEYYHDMRWKDAGSEGYVKIGDVIKWRLLDLSSHSADA